MVVLLPTASWAKLIGFCDGRDRPLAEPERIRCRIGAGAVLTIPSGQVEAARILGFSSYHTSKSIVWPQVLRSIAPALLNEYVTTLKLSTVASVISAPELLYQSGLIITQTYRPLEVYTTLAVLFAIIVIPLLRIGRVLEKRRIWKI
jgi:polar amino acid transport system permease protein